jgi:hypothetical protein
MVELKPEWVTPERVDIIKKVAFEKGLEFLRPIKEALPEDYTYNEIRLVVASLSRGSGTPS